MAKNTLLNTKIYFLLVLLIVSNIACAQTINPNWQKELDNALKQFLSCEVSKSQQADCSKFIGESLNIVYKVNDFYVSQASKHMNTNEITDFVKTNKKWKAIGHSYDQAALNKAQELANAKNAVVAVYRNADGIGHVALITPGELQVSGSWGLKVPNSASFFLKEPAKSYVGKGLSFAFAKSMMKDITLYAREY